MKLYVYDHKTKNKKYINVAASSRKKLEEKAVAEAECNTVIDLKLEHDAA
ncbi:hypothetical protein JJD66_17105 [Pseudomonas sp. MF6751]|nr:hypothetical protein [Pseudomonas sp. MF6751]